jgi:GntR family transcriptional regulator
MLPMNLELDFRSGIPIYLQVVERIRERIAGGSLPPGSQLPTVRALALELRVNFNTIARAYRILDENGIISTQQGRGTYILELPPPEITASIRRRSLQALTNRYLGDASRLGCSLPEVANEFQEQMTDWQRSGSPNPPDAEPE